MRRAAACHHISMLDDSKLTLRPQLPSTITHSTIDEIFVDEHTTFGPRVLILGPPNSGKSTLTKILVNYCTRSDFDPILCDLDCSLNMITIPGSIASIAVEQPINIEYGFNRTNAMSNDEKKQTDEQKNDGIKNNRKLEEDYYQRSLSPLIYFYGEEHPQRRLNVYKQCIEELALSVKQKMIINYDYRSAGLIVKCHSWLSGNTHKNAKTLILDIVKLFHINVIFVLDDALTFNFLKNQFSHQIQISNYFQYLHMNIQKKKKTMDNVVDERNVKLENYFKCRFIAIENVRKSTGVLPRDQKERNNIKRDIIRNYFYGPSNDWQPFSCVIRPYFLKIYERQNGQTLNSLLPIGNTSVIKQTLMKNIKPGPDLRGQILAILQINNGLDADEQNELNSMVNTYEEQFQRAVFLPPHFQQYTDGRIVDERTQRVFFAVESDSSSAVTTASLEKKAESISKSSVMGFVHVSNVEVQKLPTVTTVLRLTLLLPCVGEMPPNCLLRGHINWHDR